MKTSILLFLVLILVLCVSSCNLNADGPDSVTIDGKEFKKAFIGELYPVDERLSNADSVKISGTLYYKYSKLPYDCYITYDRNAEPNIYFEKENFEEAVSYYSDATHFSYFCLFGNIHDENQQQVIEIQKMDISMFNSLLDYSIKNNYNPLTSSNSEEKFKKLPIQSPDNWIADEIHFYKESKDGAFSTSKGYTFILLENQLCFLYQYDFSNDKAPVMLVRDVPSDVNDYFCSLLKELRTE